MRTLIVPVFIALMSSLSGCVSGVAEGVVKGVAGNLVGSISDKAVSEIGGAVMASATNTAASDVSPYANLANPNKIVPVNVNTYVDPIANTKLQTEMQMNILSNPISAGFMGVTAALSEAQAARNVAAYNEIVNQGGVSGVILNKMNKQFGTNYTAEEMQAFLAAQQAKEKQAAK